MGETFDVDVDVDVAVAVVLAVVIDAVQPTVQDERIDFDCSYCGVDLAGAM